MKCRIGQTRTDHRFNHSKGCVLRFIGLKTWIQLSDGTTREGGWTLNQDVKFLNSDSGQNVENCWA